VGPDVGVQVRTGCRPGEMYALEEADLDLDHRQAHIRRTLADRGSRIESTPKGNRARTIDLSAETVTILHKHLLDRKVAKLKFGWSEMPTPLFCSHAGTYANPSTLRREMNKVLRAAKLPHFSPHGLRHTFASLYLTTAEHPDLDYLKRQLGHASIQETVDTYGNWLKKSRPEALDCIDRAPTTAKKETA
jgi:integrase